MNREQHRASILADQASRNFTNTHLGSETSADLASIKRGLIAGLAVCSVLTVVHYWPQIVAAVWGVVS